jgi:hypothetical protein
MAIWAARSCLRWACIAFGAAALLQGCAEFAPQAPDEPTADQTVQFNSTELAKLPNLTRVSLVKLGYALSDDQCDRFFAALQVARNKNEYNAAQIAALTAFVTPTMTALDAGAKAIGITGGVFGFGTTTALNYSKYVLLTQYNTELQDLVHSAKIQYKKTVDANNSVTSTMDLSDAYIIIKGYAWLCTLPGIDSLARSALSTGAQATGAAKPGAPPTPSSPPPPPPPGQAPAPRLAPAQAGGAAGVAGTSVIAPQILVVRP